MRNTMLLLLTVLFVTGSALSAPYPAFAQDGDTDEALRVLENTFKNLGVLAIKFMYTLSFIVMVVGGVKNGFAISVAQQIGVANMASRHTWNFIMGIVVFVLFLATLPILNLVINNVTHLVPDNIDIYTPSWN